MRYNDLSPLSVVPYSRDYLIDFIRHKTGWNQRNEVADKRQLNYLCKYLEVDHIQCKTIVVESDYVDRHYLEDYAEYYARCFPSHPRNCARLHFLSISIDEHAFLERLTNFKPDFQELLEKSYLGFAVIRPIPHTFLARVCIKPYTTLTDTTGYKLIKKANFVSLFGLTLSVETAPFVEQDKVVAACATSSIWAALSASSQTSLYNLPSPSAITKSASHPTLESARTFPTNGLTPAQVARSLKHFGLEPTVLTVDETQDFAALKENIFSYVTNSIPVIIGGDVYEADSDGKAHYLGKHLVCALGYRRAESIAKHGINLVAHQIDRIYVHDDRYGPYVRLAMPPVSFTSEGKQRSGLALSIHGQNGDYFVPEVVIVGLYHKVRITYEYINNICATLYTYLLWSQEDIESAISQGQLSEDKATYFSQRAECISKAITGAWEISLATASEIKAELLATPAAWTFNGAANKGSFLLQNMPKYIWRCRIYSRASKEELFTDILFDATEVPQGRILLGFINFAPEADDLWSFVDSQIADREWQRYHVTERGAKQYIGPVIKFFTELEKKTYLNALYGPPGLPRRQLKPGEIDEMQNVQSRKDIYTVRRDTDGLIWEKLDKKRKYIWVINEMGDIVIGEDVNDASGFKGHPTLIDGKPGRIAGELRYSDADASWLVNLKSRAYSGHIDFTSAEGKAYLQNVIQTNLTGLNVKAEES